MFVDITMNRLPEATINKIMLYVSHPVADIISNRLNFHDDMMIGMVMWILQWQSSM